MAPRADTRRIDDLAKSQDDVITSLQLHTLGATTDWITRQVRGKRWQRLLPGVYLTHTGQNRWRSRARAALLYAGRGAALSHSSAAFHHNLIDRPGAVVHVSVPHGRRVARQKGIEIHRRRHMPQVWGRLPATGPIDTVVDMSELDSTTADGVVSLVCAALQRNVDGEQMLKAVLRRRSLRHRALLLDLLAVVDKGIESALEYRYHRVERAHGLPQSQLQVRQVLDGLWLRADCVYRRYRLRIELGQLAHPFGRTDSDVWRDNAVVISTEELTLRYRWRHVAITPCQVARQVALALRARGWRGAPKPCGPTCAVVGLVDAVV